MSSISTNRTNSNPGKPSNLSDDSSSRTGKFFNNYFVVTDTVSDNTNDAILSFFENQTQNKTAARALSQAVINTAKQQNLDPLAVLEDFKKLNQTELNAYLALYLNMSRVNTSLLGVKNQPRANKYVQRTIVV